MSATSGGADELNPQPLPPRAGQIRLDEFLEVATAAVLRAMAARGISDVQTELNPQPIPPGRREARNPQPIPPGGPAELAAAAAGRPRIILGLIFDPAATRQ